MRKEMAVSMVLATALVAGAIAIADHSLATKTPAGNGSLHHQEQHSMPLAAAMPATARSLPPAHSPHVFHGISKCLLDGQTSYSNNGCPRGAIPEPVVLHDTAGIEDKNRELLAALRTSSQPVARQEAKTIRQVSQQAGTKSAGQAGKQLECAALKKEIERVDASARQPQSAKSQDRLREKKKKLRDRYSTLRC